MFRAASAESCEPLLFPIAHLTLIRARNGRSGDIRAEEYHSQKNTRAYLCPFPPLALPTRSTVQLCRELRLLPYSVGASLSAEKASRLSLCSKGKRECHPSSG